MSPPNVFESTMAQASTGISNKMLDSDRQRDLDQAATIIIDTAEKALNEFTTTQE